MTACVDAVEAAIAAPHPGRGWSALPRAWLACGVTAILVTKAVGWARVARARLGTSALAALAWMCRHATRPWERLLGASVRRLLRHDGMPHGGLVSDETEKPRAPSAKNSASRHPRRETDSAGGLLGQRRVVLLGVTPQITMPVGVACSRPAPALTAWDTHARLRQQQGLPRPPGPPNPPATPQAPTTQALALCVLPPGHAPPPDLTVPGLVAEARDGTAAGVEDASTIVAGVQVIRPRRRQQPGRAYTRESQVAASWATPPGTPQPRRSRGGAEGVAIVGSARWYVSAHRTTRGLRALTDEGEATSRDLLASDRRGRTRDMVHAHPRRGLVEVVVPDWKADDGWGTVTQQPGEEGSRRRVILSRRVEHGLVLAPDQPAPLKHPLPASTVGSRRAQVQGEGWVTVLQALVAAEEPHAQRPRCPPALHDGCA